MFQASSTGRRDHHASPALRSLQPQARCKLDALGWGCSYLRTDCPTSGQLQRTIDSVSKDMRPAEVGRAGSDAEMK